MKFVEISRPGAPEVLQLSESALPEVQVEDVLIRVAAAGVNRPDIAQRQGRYAPPPGASPHPGLEVAGTVSATGAGVTGFAIGDPVCALVNGGGYAEYVSVPCGQCLPVPAGLSMVQAAALPETLFTVWANVFERGGLKGGETFLVHGGASGIGTVAIQLAAAWNARVFTTAGSAQKCQVCRDLGAELAVNYRQEDFVAVLKDATGGAGVDLILDMVAGPYLSRNVALAAQNGRIVMIAALGGASAELAVFPVMAKGLVITGSLLRPRTSAQKAALAGALRKHVWPLLERGKVAPVIHRVFPLAEAASAHALMESGEHIGKIVLQVADGD